MDGLMDDHASLRLLFAGTPDFAVRILDALVATRHRLVAVLCRPDQPAGRGHQVNEPAVKRRARSLGLPILQPPSLKDHATQAAIAELKADLMVVAAYGLILPQAVLQMPRLGCVNVHASLLPRWRGAAPIQRAIEAGDRQTGITIMQMDAGLDTGPMLLTRALPIGEAETGGQLHDRLAALGAQLIVEAIDQRALGRLQPHPQPLEGVCHAARIERNDEWLDWARAATDLANRIRAFDPVPGTRTRLLREPELLLKVWSARAVEIEHAAPPGTVLAAGAGQLRVACGRGALDLLELQRPGGRRQPVEDWLRGFAVVSGERLS
jgi:methionyl-tRNA formyltransferase